MIGFAHYALLWGLTLAALPPLIHLINMMRQRRVAWAAMEFLLASQKKHRTWILLKQILLLLARIAAIALLVLVVAQPRLRSEWGKWFGGSRTHHVVLLDDSFSMSDRWADTSAFEQAKAVVQRIGEEAARQVQPQQFTLLRFSRAQLGDRSTQPDLLQETVDSQFAARLRDKLTRLAPAESAAGPREALDTVEHLLSETNDDRRVVYLVSDFPARQWDDPRELRGRLLRLNEKNAALALVNCVEGAHANLAIASLAAEPALRAAGVSFYMEVGVENFGPATVRNVAVTLEEDGRARSGVTLAEIPPGRVARERFLVNFATAGPHRVAARLETDSVAADNFRYAVVDVPAEIPVLLADGSPDGRSARFVAAALAPRGPVRTGIAPHVETPRFLGAKPLAPYQAVYLLDVERLEPAAVTAVEDYVRAGGNVVFFAGERTSSRFVNDSLYRDGKGLFPAPLSGAAELAVDHLQPAPDLQLTEHPMFRVFAGQQNSAIHTVNIRKYFAVEKGWKPPPAGPVRVIASLRNGDPLVIENPCGAGRVIAVLTTAAPDWNNWAQDNPTFLAALLSLQAYLVNTAHAAPEHLMGGAVRVQMAAADYRPQVQFVRPQRGAVPLPAVQAVLNAEGQLSAALLHAEQAGFYEARLARQNGSTEIRTVAVNVDPGEGNLQVVTPAHLAAKLEGVRYDYAAAATFQFSSRDLEGANLSQSLLYALVILLLCEQVLAWSASYHPSARHALPRGGAA